MRSNIFDVAFWYPVCPMVEFQRLERERDLYRRLLELGHADEIDPLLTEALQLAVEITGAERVYLRLSREDSEAPHPASLAHQCTAEELSHIETRISHGIIAESMAQGRSSQTPSAFLDERFKDLQSVETNEIEAVLCAPIGAPSPIGVLYVQGRTGAGPFGHDEMQMVDDFARHLGQLTHRLIERQALRDAHDPCREWRTKISCDGLIGQSAALADMFKTVAAIAPLDGIDVLLTGESGTGKTVVAKVIAINSGRALGPFVELNCSAIPETLIEAELFGALKGSHSTAHTDIVGKVHAADGGTLFLDEVADLTMAAQAKLLQFLQSRTFFPIGSAHAEKVDVRVIAATNADLQERVSEGTFREDLFYRLHVMPMRLPALSERTADIPRLAEYFARRAAERNGLPEVSFAPKALSAAQSADWPGNLRQLDNAIQAALVRAASEKASVIAVHHLFPDRPPKSNPSYQDATRQFQATLLHQTLQNNGWNISKTARELELTRSHVYNLMQGFGIVRGS